MCFRDQTMKLAIVMWIGLLLSDMCGIPTVQSHFAMQSKRISKTRKLFRPDRKYNSSFSIEGTPKNFLLGYAFPQETDTIDKPPSEPIHSKFVRRGNSFAHLFSKKRRKHRNRTKKIQSKGRQKQGEIPALERHRRSYIQDLDGLVLERPVIIEEGKASNIDKLSEVMNLQDLERFQQRIQLENRPISKLASPKYMIKWLRLPTNIGIPQIEDSYIINTNRKKNGDSRNKVQSTSSNGTLNRIQQNSEEVPRSSGRIDEIIVSKNLSNKSPARVVNSSRSAEKQLRKKASKQASKQASVKISRPTFYVSQLGRSCPPLFLQYTPDRSNITLECTTPGILPTLNSEQWYVLLKLLNERLTTKCFTSATTKCTQPPTLTTTSPTVNTTPQSLRGSTECDYDMKYDFDVTGLERSHAIQRIYNMRDGFVTKEGITKCYEQLHEDTAKINVPEPQPESETMWLPSDYDRVKFLKFLKPTHKPHFKPLFFGLSSAQKATQPNEEVSAAEQMIAEGVIPLRSGNVLNLKINYEGPKPKPTKSLQNDQWMRPD